MKRPFLSHLGLVALGSVAILLCLAPDALAQMFTQGVSAEEFSCNGSGPPTGDLFNSGGSCNGLLTGLVCTFENVLSQIFGRLYCGMQSNLIGPLGTVLTIYIAVVGIGFLTGMMPGTTAEAFKHLLKLVLVWAFAANAALGIGVAYKFFMSTAQEGVTVAMSALRPADVAEGEWTAGAAIRHMDEIMLDKILFLTERNHSTTEDAQGKVINQCAGAMLKMAVLFMIVAPPAFFLVAYSAYNVFMVFARAVLGYLLAVTGLTFLMTVSPIFIPMALFKSTSSFFDKWLHHLITFSLQMIIIFAFIALSELISLSSFTAGMLDVIMPYKANLSIGNLKITDIDTCTICDYDMVMSTELRMEVPKCNLFPKLDGTGTEFHAIPPLDLLRRGNFILVLVTKIISLIILTYALDAFMEKVPDLAAQLAGPRYALRLGGHSMTPEAIAAELPGGAALAAAWNAGVAGYNNTQSDLSPLKAVGGAFAAWEAAKKGVLDEFADEATSFGAKFRRPEIKGTPKAAESKNKAPVTDPNVKDVAYQGNKHYKVTEEKIKDLKQVKTVKIIRDLGNGHFYEYEIPGTDSKEAANIAAGHIVIDMGNGYFLDVRKSQIPTDTLAKLESGAAISQAELDEIASGEIPVKDFAESDARLAGAGAKDSGAAAGKNPQPAQRPETQAQLEAKAEAKKIAKEQEREALRKDRERQERIAQKEKAAKDRQEATEVAVAKRDKNDPSVT